MSEAHKDAHVTIYENMQDGGHAEGVVYVDCRRYIYEVAEAAERSVPHITVDIWLERTGRPNIHMWRYDGAEWTVKPNADTENTRLAREAVSRKYGIR